MTRQLAAVGFSVLGWILFFVCLWFHHRPQGGQSPIPPEVEEQLGDAGFTEGEVSTVPPVKVIRETVHVPGADRVVYVYVAAPATETEPPKVVYVAENCVNAQGPQLPNWTLRPGDLGLRDGSLDVRKAGRRGFVKFEATLTGQTPQGEVSRTIAPDEASWLSTKALELPPRFGPALDVTTLPTLSGGFYWTVGRKQYDAQAGYDFDRQRWFGKGGVRF